MSIEETRQKKVHRIQEGQVPRIIDLFAGCGGLSLGFFSSGFSILGGIESDAATARSYGLNFHPEENPGVFSKARNITSLSPTGFVQELYPGEDPQTLTDILIGGPPCQAFARIGRAKLRKVAEEPEAFRLDNRAKLPLQYLRFVDELCPVALVMENVIDILNFGGENIALEICEILTQKGYVCRYTTLNAVYYGVPQMRERFFLIALAVELNRTPEFPSPSHWIELPSGYKNARKIALTKHTKLSGEQRVLDTDTTQNSAGFWVEPPSATPRLPPAVTAREAIEDLPPIFDTLTGAIKRGTKKFDTLIPYPSNGSLTPYGALMRNWSGFENHIGISDHVIRYLPRDYPIFERMRPGDQYPEAHRTAMSLFNEKMQELKQSGIEPEEGTVEYERLRRSIVPPYDPGKFPNQWRKMEADKPARTLMAHLGKDSYSHIHYDSTQARTISVREAARLQSFPDGFRFCGAMNSAFRQIGNAVPPLLSKAIATSINLTLRA